MVNSDGDHSTSYLEHNTQYSLNWGLNSRAMPLAISRLFSFIRATLIGHSQRFVIAIQ